MKSRAAILRSRSKAKITRRLSEAQVETVVRAILRGSSYSAAGKLVGVQASSAKYWFLRQSPEQIEALRVGGEE